MQSLSNTKSQDDEEEKDETIVESEILFQIILLPWK